MDIFFREAQEAAKYSRDPSTKVGAVVHDRVGVVGVGWNRFPKGVPADWWHDRDKKYQAVVHAEAAALISAGRLAAGSTLTVTAHPCKECAKLIIGFGIKCVVCPPGPWRDDPAVIETVEKAAELFKLCGVEVRAPDAE
jgi:dCMP deaminase